jgi:hypothetical protein
LGLRHAASWHNATDPLGNVLAELGRHADASTVMKRALRIFGTGLQVDHPRLERIRDRLEALNDQP